MKNFIDEFKKFAVRGNMIDLAVGVIIGGAFGKIVSSFVADIVMPPISTLLGIVDFSEWKITVARETFNHPVVTMNIGAFIQAVLDFTIIAITLFLAIRVINRLQQANAKDTSAGSTKTKDQELLTEIRDLLKQKPQ